MRENIFECVKTRMNRIIILIEHIYLGLGAILREHYARHIETRQFRSSEMRYPRQSWFCERSVYGLYDTASY